MKVSNVKGLANHDDPESCGGARKGDGEALTGESAGWVLSREKVSSGCRPCRRKGKATINVPLWRGRWYPARSETPGMYGSNLRENREILRPPKPARLGRIEKSKDVRR